MHHDDDKTLQRVKDGEEDLKEDGALVCHGEHRRHPGESQQRQDHTGAPQRRPETGGGEDKKKQLTLFLTRTGLQGSAAGGAEAPCSSVLLTDTYIALLAVVADKAVVDTTPHLAHLRVNPVCGSLICLWDTETRA